MCAEVGWIRTVVGIGLCTASMLAGSTPPSPTQRKGSEMVTQDLHPSGPIVRREWRVAPEAAPYRIVLEHALSGRMVVGAVRLVRASDGSWLLEPAQGTTVLLLRPNEPPPTYCKTLREGGRIWSVRVTRVDVPKEEPGVALEAEPSLNLLLERKRCR